MAQNNVDGIKKTNKEELEKSRKILLDYIGEEDKRKTERAQAYNQPITTVKTVDSLLKKKPGKQIEDKFKISDAQNLNKSAGINIANKNLITENDKSVLKNEIKKISELTKPKPVEKINPVKEPIKKNNQLEVEKLDKAKKKIQEAKVRVEKKKKKIQEERAKAEKILKQPKLKNKKKQRFYENSKFFFKLKKYSLSFIFVATVFIIIFYLFFCWLLLKMNIDTTATRLVSKYMPVPAVITEDGYLEYYYYKDLTSAYEGEDKKLAVIKKILLLDLIDRYKISDDKSTDEILSIIKQRFENDREINLHQNSLEDYLKNGIDSNKIKFLTD